MKKMMFNDKYGLTKAVLEGRKTMTRRIVPEKQLYYIRRHFRGLAVMEAPFKYDEVVAVAQAYKDIEEFNPESYEDVMLSDGVICEASHPYSNLMRSGGWDNKMFVVAEYMPHRIRITNVRVERLQDISDEDCLREGIRKVDPLESLICLNASTYQIDGPGCENTHYTSPRGAFATLIDKVSGKGTWASNPWVFVYEFELVK